MSSPELLEAGDQPAGSLLRRLLQVAVALVLLVTAAGLYFAYYASHYDPLRPGSLRDPGDATVALGLAPHADTYQLPWSPGKPQVAAFSIANHGRWAVTIDGVKENSIGSFFGILGSDAYEITASGEPGSEISLPNRLDPGHEILIDVAYLTTTCGLLPKSGGYVGASMDGLPVRWHALGVGHVTNVPTPIVRVTTPSNVAQDFDKPCV